MMVMSTALLAAAAPATPGDSSPSLQACSQVRHTSATAAHRRAPGCHAKHILCGGSSHDSRSQWHEHGLQVEGKPRQGEGLRHRACTAQRMLGVRLHLSTACADRGQRVNRQQARQQDSADMHSLPRLVKPTTGKVLHAEGARGSMGRGRKFVRKGPAA